MRRVAVCTFDGTFEPGASYRVVNAVQVKTADFALEPIGCTVDVPEGAAVVGAPDPCQANGGEDGDGRDRYLCFAGTPLLEEDKRTLDFRLRIDEVVEGAKGRVALPEWEDPREGDPSNDDGWIVLNGTGDEETPGDTGGTDDTGDPTTPATRMTPAAMTRP